MVKITDVESFHLRVKDTFDNHSGRSSFLMEGTRKEAETRRMACHQLNGRHATAFDGYMLDSIRGAFNIVSKEDADDLVYFLRISAYCLPYRNGTYVPDPEPITGR
jgi:hypothetical protein